MPLALLLTLISRPVLAADFSDDYNTCDQAAQNQLDITMCASDEYSRQDKRLNVQYSAALAQGTATDQATLRQAQRAWLTLRDATCPVPRQDQGSAAGMDHSLCLAKITKKRADELALSVPAIVVTDEPLSLADGASTSYTVKAGHYNVKIQVKDTNGGSYGVRVTSTAGGCPDQKEAQQIDLECYFTDSGTIIVNNPTGYGFGPAEMGNINITKLPDVGD